MARIRRFDHVGITVADLDPGGRRFKFADPWGNVLGVYEPGEQPGSA